MCVLFSDLDNTLIYSHRKHIRQEKIVVEYLDGKVQSYMTLKTLDYLSQNNWLSIVPITSRTECQYKRITCMDTIRVKYALVCNGGKLLIDGVEDKEWSKTTFENYKEYRVGFEACVDFIKDRFDIDSIHIPEEYMCYVKVDKPYLVVKELSSNETFNNINIYFDNRKVYFFPKSLDKGISVKRFIKRFNVKQSVGAGDDIMDISFLNCVDYAFAKSEIIHDITNGQKRESNNTVISDELCEYVRMLHVNNCI